ncbi:ATP-dependent RecD-like DNA helicase [compost metagenome]
MDDNDEDIGYEHLIGIYVKFDFGTVAIPFERMDQLMHSWALTKHKSQGGSCKAGIVIVDKAHKFNSNANLVYTGASRCKEKLIILCQADSLNFVLRKFENMSRRTFLKELLIKLHTDVNNRESA